MKTDFIIGILVLSLGSINFISCNDDDSDRWYDSMPDGGPFHTGNAMRFFYIDEDGNDLINPEDLATLPVSTRELLDSQPVIEAYDYRQYYNDEMNQISFNKQKGLHEFFTFAFGDSRKSNYTFYVYHNGIADKMDITFQYQDHKVEGGLYYLDKIISWSVNDVEVYNIKNPEMRKYVYLIKKSNGTTDVVIDK